MIAEHVATLHGRQFDLGLRVGHPRPMLEETAHGDLIVVKALAAIILIGTLGSIVYAILPAIFGAFR
jgi:hypothetical protein